MSLLPPPYGATSLAIKPWTSEAIVLPSLLTPTGGFQLDIGRDHPGEEALVLQYALQHALQDTALQKAHIPVSSAGLSHRPPRPGEGMPAAIILMCLQGSDILEGDFDCGIWPQS
ncbi:hypothetical protein DPSP01_007507 [Paraphaeosphaeria sporulosa]